MCTIPENSRVHVLNMSRKDAIADSPTPLAASPLFVARIAPSYLKFSISSKNLTAIESDALGKSPRSATMPPSYHSSTRIWTLTSLIGSYLDLVLAYLFLIGSTLVFLASKFLSFFGLSLPWSCSDGLYGQPHCFQTLLLDSSRTRIESLHSSIRTRFPLDVIFNENIGSEPNKKPLKLTGPEGDGEDMVMVENQGARVIGPKIRRRRVLAWRKGKSVLVSVSPGMRFRWKGEGLGDNFGCQSKEESSVSVGSGHWHRVAEDDVSMGAEAPSATEYFSVEDASSATRYVNPLNENLEQIVENLEQELEEAHAAHATLYLELEKERSAAATAADEAMAMILRLQSEKAVIEMESRQYQRMIEEKSAYDEEEMEILKEIIARREREKYVLEKEVEAYGQMMLSGQITGEKPDSLFDSSNDPMLMLKNICDSIREEQANSKMKWTDDRAGMHYPEVPEPGDECNIEFQEKGIVTLDVYPSGHCQSSSFMEETTRYTIKGSQELGFCKEPSWVGGEEDARRECKVEMRIPVDELDREDQDGDKRGSASSQFETDTNVLDVHVIEDKHNLGIEENKKASDAFKVVCASELSEKGGVADELSGTGSFDVSTDTPVANSLRGKQEGYQLMDILSDNAPNFDLRRGSMSAVNSERFKLETEVELLRERLKTIQQGRENLSFSVEYREKERFQLQLLEEIGLQLQEIRKITEPGRSIRQASLPPLSSKVNSKKRRCHSFSSGLHDSA